MKYQVSWKVVSVGGGASMDSCYAPTSYSEALKDLAYIKAEAQKPCCEEHGCNCSHIDYIRLDELTDDC
jgi:hypothetical protein